MLLVYTIQLYGITRSAPTVYRGWNAGLKAVDLAVMKPLAGNTMDRNKRSVQSPSSGRVGSSLAEELAVAFTKALDQICAPTDKLCLPGPKGELGAPGWPGQPGVKGKQGIHGRHGTTGLPGKQGPAGIQGPKGNKGDKGDIGVRGDTGQIGLKGNQGLKGSKGEVGVKGERGYPGFKGDVGPTGNTGNQGVKGSMGEKGEKGNKGEEPAIRFPTFWPITKFDGYVGIRTSSSRSVTVFGFPAFLRVGDEVLLIQMQGSNAGYYELHNVSSISGTAVHMKQFIHHSYTSSSSTAAQLVRIESFSSLRLVQNVSARPWDGHTGGIVAIRAETLFIEQEGGIDVSRLGRGKKIHWFSSSN